MIIQIIRPYFKQSYINPLEKHTAKHHLRKERDVLSARFKDYRRTRKPKYRHPCSESHFSLTHVHLPTPFQLLSHHTKQFYFFHAQVMCRICDHGSAHLCWPISYIYSTYLTFGGIRTWHRDLFPQSYILSLDSPNGNEKFSWKTNLTKTTRDS